MVIKRIVIIALLLTASQSLPGQEKYWIYFTDRGAGKSRSALLKSNEDSQLSERARHRRARMMPEHQIIEENDLPLHAAYVEQIESMGVKSIVQSRWLNAMSAWLTESQRTEISNQHFVKKVTPVLRFTRKLPAAKKQETLEKSRSYQLDYGASLDQNELMRVPEVHDLGLDGSDVIVGMLDTGFDYKDHEAFAHLQVAAEYDFINNDSTTQNEEQNNDWSSQINHGTLTLSAIGGFKSGELIGPAFGATYFLAKTEDVRSETEVEEDFWVAGIEWLERQGVDVVNSSLGYNNWYSYPDMDGTTATTTIAAGIAVSKGVVVVNSAGNEGNDSWRYVIAPADGFNVIAVGAVFSTGDLVEFSSRGPTYDGRIKPDVMAQGWSVHSVQPGTLADYGGASGTSLASPLVAGVAALVLQAHPYLTPSQVRDALRNTASLANSPNNDFGWGIVDAYEAIFYHGLFFSRMPEISTQETIGHPVIIQVFSKQEIDGDSVALFYSAEGGAFQKLKMQASGQPHEFEAVIPLQPRGAKIDFYFYANDSETAKFNPFKAPDAFFTYIAYDTTVIPPSEPLPEAFQLYQNYPNPFQTITTISYDILEPGNASLTIFNILGQRVRAFNAGYHERNNYKVIWDGLDEQGRRIAAGIYFVQLKTDHYSTAKRVIFLGSK
ncbi:MAG: S8/S53 family peptidase [Candidatus Zhuqueibacterota bacterium]